MDIMAVAKAVEPGVAEAYAIGLGVSLLALCVLGLVYSQYMLYRNKKVAEWRRQQLGDVPPIEVMLLMMREDPAGFQKLLAETEDRQNRYDKLPSYETMLHKFWVWPLDKFLPRDESEAA